MPPGMPAVVGRANLVNAFKEMSAVFTGVKVATGPVYTSGELVASHGTYQAKLKLANGRTVDDKGKFLEVYRKEKDGSWKILLDTFSSDLEHSE